MSQWIRQPLTYNIITIMSLVVALFAVLATSGAVSDNAKAEVTLEQLAAETDAVDEAMLASVKESRDRRNQHGSYIYLMAVIAVLSNFAANYFGRGRNHSNVARIRELEAQLDANS